MQFKRVVVTHSDHAGAVDHPQFDVAVMATQHRTASPLPGVHGFC